MPMSARGDTKQRRLPERDPLLSDLSLITGIEQAEIALQGALLEHCMDGVSTSPERNDGAPYLSCT